MYVPRITRWVIGIWVLVAGTYALMSLLLKPGPALTAFDDIVLCLAPLLANAGLLLNAGSANWRRNLFWMLLALGCTVWMAGQFVWTYYELYLHRSIPTGSPSDIIFFLHGIPTMAAIALQPHKDEQARKLTNGYVDFTLLLLWWVYLFLFTVSPWNLAVSEPAAQGAPDEGVWLRRVAMATIISLPFLALWDFWFSGEIRPVRDFRLLVTVLAAIPLGILIFLRQQLLDKERLRLLEESRQSIQDLKHLQTQLVQSEKLVSLGQLPPRPPHDINHPPTPILRH